MRFNTGIFAWWEKLLGDPDKFPLHVRLLHATCLVSILGLGYNVPFNYLVGLPDVAFLSFASLAIVTVLYYLSRLKDHNAASIVIMNILGPCLFTCIYFLNSGSHGPTLIYALLFLLLSIGMSPASQYKIWLPINLIIVMLLHLLEYFRPDLIPMTYVTRSGKFVDLFSSYLVVALLSFLCINYIRMNYEKEKQSTIKKSVDIQQKNEYILKQNQELKKLNDEKNKFLSIIAHDLRSPLASIQSYLLLLTQVDLEPDERGNLQSELLDSTINTMSMLSKLLDWSKSQLHGLVPRFESVNLHDLIESLVSQEKHVAVRKSITIQFDVDPTIVIYADPDMMHVVLRNLIGNAIKFTPVNGNVVIRAENVQSECVISVQDNGIGIPSDQQDALFSLQARSTYGTENEKGVGLGLLLCKEFVNAQNGRLWFLSQLSQGTCFYISIPLA